MMAKEKAVEEHAQKRTACKKQSKEAGLGFIARKKFVRDCMAAKSGRNTHYTVMAGTRVRPSAGPSVNLVRGIHVFDDANAWMASQLGLVRVQRI